VDSSGLKSAASSAATKSRSFISAQLDERSTQLGTTVSATAGDLHRIADELRAGETVSGSADFAERGADFVDRIGTYLTAADGERLIHDAENFARQRPWAVATAALVAGFAASRILKASSKERYRDAYGHGD
jgi:hypothetical protein